MAEVLNVKRRNPQGKRHARRLREQGNIPVNLYGHGQENVYLAVPAEQVRSMVRHSARVVDLAGDIQEKAFVREMQWDPFGLEVLHLDLTRVSADERVEVNVTVELRGTSPGVKEGGILDHVMHEVEIDCLAIEIPEKLFLRVGELKLNGSLTASAVELPAGVKLLTDPEAIVVNCVPPAAEGEEAPLAAEGAEPEVIGRKASDDEAEEE
ncbi:MAG TPA: 50S ribosomal protein L25 [Pirellulales bacterium]|jgi:large subunit ribosomal protein L25|nr:50S ribosomal protein L25 [Pirellulales bacterium]